MSTAYDRENPGRRFCPECGQEVSPGGSFCPGCGARLEEEPGPKEESFASGSEWKGEAFEPETEELQEERAGEELGIPEEWRGQESGKEEDGPKRSRGVPSGLATGFFSLFFILFAAMLPAIAFFHGLAANVHFPSVGGISGDRLTELLESVLLLLLGGILVAIPLFCMVFLNIRRIRRFFFSLGISGLLTGLISLLLGLFWPSLVENMSGGLQSVLKASMEAFQDVSFMFALLWMLLGAVLLSVYSCIMVCRGKKYEKNM